MSTVRLLAPSERQRLASLFEELLAHYGMPARPRDAIESVLANAPGGVEFLAAFEGDSIVGFATFSHLFPGEGIAPQIYMKDLYVASAARSGGVGEALVQALARIARDRDCTRLDWTTERSNEGARAFYARLGAREVTTKVFYRLDRDGIDAVARGTSSPRR